VSERHGACSSRSVATCRWRYLHVPPEAGPPLAVVGEGGRDARAAQCVLVSLRSRRAGGGTRVCRPARVLCRPWLERSVASRERHGACLSRCDRDAPVAAHTHVTPGAGPPPAMAGGVRRVARAARCVLVSLRPRRASGGTHTCVARRGPSAGRGWGGQSRRASGTVRARLPAIATRQWRTHMCSPAQALRRSWRGGGVGRVARAARCVLVSLRSRRAGVGTHVCHPGRALRLPWLGREIASRELHGACSSRCDRDAPAAAHACAARCGPSAGRGWGGRLRRAGGTVCSCLAAIATRRRRHTHVPPQAGPPSAVAGEGGGVA
jgi:hypothetical protein